MTDYSGLDVCCFYTDLGREGYEPLMADMTASAHEQMPGCRTLLLSPNPTAKTAQHFDGVVPIENCDVDANKLCFNRGRAHVSWMTLTEATTSPRSSRIGFARIIDQRSAPVSQNR